MKNLIYAFTILSLLSSCDSDPGEPETIEVSSTHTDKDGKVQTIRDTTYEQR